MDLDENIIFGTVQRSGKENDVYGLCGKCEHFSKSGCPHQNDCYYTLHKPWYEPAMNRT